MFSLHFLTIDILIGATQGQMVVSESLHLHSNRPYWQNTELMLSPSNCSDPYSCSMHNSASQSYQWTKTSQHMRTPPPNFPLLSTTLKYCSTILNTVILIMNLSQMLQISAFVGIWWMTLYKIQQINNSGQNNILFTSVKIAWTCCDIM